MDDFRKAVVKVAGLEFLAQVEDDPEEPDLGFSTVDNKGKLEHTLFVLAQNEQALRQIQRMWDLWREDERADLGRGFAQWRTVFAMLKDVRPWGPEDRLGGTHLHHFWQAELSRGANYVNAEIELWFRASETARHSAQDQLIAELQAAQAEILDIVALPEIAYHAVLARVDASLAQSTLSGRSALINNPRVSYVRPQSMGLDSSLASNIGNPTKVDSRTQAIGTPLAAVLDGLPLTGHSLLRDRFEVDDPHDFDSVVDPSDRHHGTAIASLVIWGDLQQDDPALTRPIHIHPIFSSTRLVDGTLQDTMKTDRLPVGVMSEILQRMFVGDSEHRASAPTVRLVVLAAGHTALPFGAKLSPWARLLDVYAERFNVLFIVSAGNHISALELPDTIAPNIVDNPTELQKAIRQHLLSRAHERRILAPGEAMNVLTVGALHADSASNFPLGTALDVMGSNNLPSPVSALGGGYHRQIKPDLFADGGRVLYRHRWDEVDRVILDLVMSGDSVPGLRVASPGVAGDATAERWFQGTSAATGLVGHYAAEIMELLTERENGPLVEQRFLGVATKAVLVNSACWQGADIHIAEVIAGSDSQARRRNASRLLGYGTFRPGRSTNGSEKRITVLATGLLLGDDARAVSIPVPPSLNGRGDWRRVAITLAWFTPVNPRHRTYRQAKVWFDPVNEADVGLLRKQADYHAARRGTVQHEVLEGTRVMSVGTNDVLTIRVNCSGAAGGLVASVPFAIAATFEVEDSSEVRVYREVATALRARTNVRTARARIR